MRKLVVSVLTSLDGCYEGPGGSLATLPFEDAFNTHNLELLERADTMVYGSTWFEANLTHWAAVGADPAQPERDRRIADLVAAVDCLVISDRYTVSPDAPWADRTRVVGRDAAAGEIARLKELDGGDLLMFGSATTWNPLLEAGLVDELIVIVGAGLAGDGVRLYSGAPVDLRLLDAQVLPDSSLVRLRYAGAPR